jgi:hypothetical protein
MIGRSAFSSVRTLVINVGLALLACYAPICLAQVDTGEIAGTVRDASGGILARAAVVITNPSTGSATRLITGDHGQYVSSPLRPGTYTVSAEVSGFRRTVATVVLTLNERALVDLTLDVGAVAEQVTVNAPAPLLESESATVGYLRDQEAIQDLPMNTRNFNTMITLGTGVAPASTQSSSVALTGIRGVTENAVNGFTFRSNRYLVDGIDNSENHNGRGLMLYPPVDAIMQVHVETSVASAEFGRGGGGSINVYYKSGSNELHGDVFEFLRNSAFDARNFFSNTNSTPPFRMNQFGGTLGGPIRRNRTFFFFAYEGERRRQSLNYNASVPLSAFKLGDFSSHPNRIYDPMTTGAGSSPSRDPFPNNTIPVSRQDPVGRALIALYPTANLPGLAGNYTSNPSQSLNRDTFDIKLDHSLSSRDQVFARYSHHAGDQYVPGSLPLPAAGAVGGTGNNRFPAQQIVTAYTHTVSPNQVNEFRAGFTRTRIDQLQLNWGINVDDTVGIPGINSSDLRYSGLSSITASGFQALGDWGQGPSIIVSENYQFNDTFSRVQGNHTFKFGGEAARRHYNIYLNTSQRGAFDFGPIYTTNPASPSRTGISLADMLLGTPASGSITYLPGTLGLRRTEYAFFMHDTWKVTRSLTLDYGLRYEIFAGYPWTEVANRMANFRTDLGNVFVVGSPQVPQRSGTNANYKNFGPRLGVAYKIGSHTVFRGGYGVFYSAEQISAQNLGGYDPPLTASNSFANNQLDFSGGRRIAQGFTRPATLAGTITGSSLVGIDPNFRTPYAQQWNGGLQQSLSQTLLVSAQYVGTAGKRLVLNPDINQPTPGPGTLAARRPYPSFNSISYNESAGSSIYHSLQLSAEKRLSSRLNFLASYTWAHGIDNGDFQGTRQNLNDLRSERGSSVADLRQRFVASWTYSLPFLIRNPVMGGWEISGISNVYSGLPFTPTSSINTLNSSGTQRPNRIGSGVLPNWTLNRYFDVGAFTTPAPYQFGNSGRDILYGPGTLQFDVGLMKNFRISERRRTRLQFRSEFFNIFNRPQFNNPNVNIGTAAAGQITSAGSDLTFQRTCREIQMALKLYW